MIGFTRNFRIGFVTYVSKAYRSEVRSAQLHSMTGARRADDKVQRAAGRQLLIKPVGTETFIHILLSRDYFIARSDKNKQSTSYNFWHEPSYPNL